MSSRGACSCGAMDSSSPFLPLQEESHISADREPPRSLRPWVTMDSSLFLRRLNRRLCPPPPLQHQGLSSAEIELRPASASPIEQQSGMHTFPASYATQTKALRSSPSPSSSPPSSSSSSASSSSSSSSSSMLSSESLRPISIHFKRLSSRYRHRSPSPALFSSQCQMRTFGEQNDNSCSFITEIDLNGPKLCLHQMPPSARSADALPSLSSSQKAEESSIKAARPQHTEGMPREDILKRIDVDKEEEDKRKRIMWRAACAMAHAYVHRHELHQDAYAHRQDVHRHELCHPERHQHDLHESIQQPHMLNACKDGCSLPKDEVCDVRATHPVKSADSVPHQQDKDCGMHPSKIALPSPHQLDEVCYVRLACPAKSAPPLPPPVPIKSSPSEEVYPSSISLLNDVVCIDEVVNPTQAAEWFGALFLSTSTLVS